MVAGVSAEQGVAPERAAILVSRDTSPLQAARQVNAVVRPPEVTRVALLTAPEAILNPDGGMIELADAGDRGTAEFVLHRLTEQFGAVVKEHYYRNLFGDLEREREYWWLDVRGNRYMLMRATAPEAPPGVCVGGPIGTPEQLALFCAIAASFGAVVQDRRPRAKKPWWRIW